jgi:hypothetical protein
MLSYFTLEFGEARICANGLQLLKSDETFCVDSFSYIAHFLSLYAKVIAVLIRTTFFVKNIKFQNFPKILLREVHTCQRILKFEIFIIFVYCFRCFFVHGRKKWVQPFSPGW